MSEKHYVAYHGFAFLKGATDSHKTGLQIQLRLEHEKDYRVFKEFKKHRKGKAGSGLYRALTKAEGAEEWYGPVDLKFLRWTVSSANGAVITFEMEDYDEWRKMRDGPAIDAGYEEAQLNRVELMLLELDQEGKPINVKQRAYLEELALKRRWPKGGAQSKRAARLCQDKDFAQWVIRKVGMNTAADVTPAMMADWMRKECDIDSRAQLDHDPAALQRFEDRVMKPFLRTQLH
jgi:hypothetical protein